MKLLQATLVILGAVVASHFVPRLGPSPGPYDSGWPWRPAGGSPLPASFPAGEPTADAPTGDRFVAPW